MKKVWVFCFLTLFLTGCAAADTWETIADEPDAAVMAVPGEVFLELPEEAASPVLHSDMQQVYLCEDYEIILENHTAGDLTRTIRSLTGFDREGLTVIKTAQGTADRYEFVWACAGEKGERLGRAVILDDGQYHYCLSVLRDSGTDPEGIEPLFASFRLI